MIGGAVSGEEGIEESGKVSEEKQEKTEDGNDETYPVYLQPGSDFNVIEED